MRTYRCALLISVRATYYLKSSGHQCPFVPVRAPFTKIIHLKKCEALRCIGLADYLVPSDVLTSTVCDPAGVQWRRDAKSVPVPVSSWNFVMLEKTCWLRKSWRVYFLIELKPTQWARPIQLVCFQRSRGLIIIFQPVATTLLLMDSKKKVKWQLSVCPLQLHPSIIVNVKLLSIDRARVLKNRATRSLK